MQEFFGVQIKKNEKGKVCLAFWGCVNISGKPKVYVSACAVIVIAVYYLVQ